MVEVKLALKEIEECDSLMEILYLVKDRHPELDRKKLSSREWRETLIPIRKEKGCVVFDYKIEEEK